jgi:ribosomal protein L18E
MSRPLTPHTAGSKRSCSYLQSNQPQTQVTQQECRLSFACREVPDDQTVQHEVRVLEEAAARILVSCSKERLQSRLRPPKNQRMHIMRPLVGVHRLEVDHVPDDVVLVVDAVAAVHVARHARDVE